MLCCSPTAACRQGRTATVVLRCTKEVEQNEYIELPPKCGDGTCDGCNFLFMIKTALACPVCTADDIETYLTKCKDGVQSVITKTKTQTYVIQDLVA
jgi:hypothetical protein